VELQRGAEGAVMRMGGIEFGIVPHEQVRGILNVCQWFEKGGANERIGIAED
jgi:hypothetical protein